MTTQKSRSISLRVSYETYHLVEILRGNLSVTEYIMSLIERDYDDALLLGRINIQDTK